MKKYLLIVLSIFAFIDISFAQTATKSYPFAVGRSGSCGSGSSQIHFYNYDGNTNTLQNASGGLVNPCIPQLRIGTSGGGGGSQRFTSNLASVSFNPADHNIYYLWTNLSTSPVRTYAWRWPVGTCPTSTSPRLDTIRSFAADILGVAFDNSGNGYILEFTGEPNGVPHKAMIRSINFSTGVIGGADTLSFTGGMPILVTGSGDVAMSPSGQMFFVVENKLFTPNYSAYTGTGAYLTCTYVNTFSGYGSASFVGLTYAQGEAIAAYSGSGCPFDEVGLLSGVTAPITKNNSPTNLYSTSDLATVVSGIGAAKSLVSVTPTGTANQYDVVYDIVVRNYGNMDIDGVQVTDNLGLINGAGNVSNVSVSIPVNPNGYTVNPAYNGTTNINLLAGTSNMLPNYPVANSSFTIRITCRLSGILAGVVYNNRAIATATDFNNNALLDSSTNGSIPDLNSNDKPDDFGESQPTPLLISVTAFTPPCVSLTNILYTQTFGTGTGRTTSMGAPTVASGVLFPTGTSSYAGSTTTPLPLDRYVVTNNANNANAAQFLSMTDHTGNPNGRMLVINADAANTVMYSGTFYYSTCANSQYSLSFYAAFPANAAYQTLCDGFGGFHYPRIRMRIRDNTSGLVITETTTGDITSASWQQYGLKFTAPASYTQLVFELINDAPGGCGNDVVIDDIQFGSCDPLPVVNANVAAGCIGSPATFNSTLNDDGALPPSRQYQWQVSTAATGPWTNIVGATASSYTIASVNATHTNRYYRVLVAATGNIGIPNCRYASPGMYLNAQTASIAATSATRDKNNICGGIQVALSSTGGTLGSGAQWNWYQSSCSGSSIGTGASINVTPNVTTTYYVRAEGICNTTSCVAVTVFISCDIDKDKDGIPDYIESYMPVAWADANSNGISNAFDPTYPGFVDNNNDYINDNFQADGDSDNDGIPNYLDTNFPGRVDTNGDGIDDRFDMDLDGIINMLDLDSDNDGIPDVVEAGGVDTNGDGRIDNFTDNDNDGLSQNVDANNTGARVSGIGLGALDLDGDGIPNAIDLDSDNDGIPDVVEAGGPDANNNAIIDGFVDANNDGLHDAYFLTSGLLRTGADANNDGRADSYPNKNFDEDRRPNAYDLDSDGDGIVDVIEAGFTDANYNGFVDGTYGADGWSNVIRARASLGLLNSDANGNPNYLDIDSDGDGIPDNIEGQTTLGYRFPTGLDSDNDGLDNAYDYAPYAATFGGAGIMLSDKDIDLIPDYIDLDSDSDGQPDIIEGHDYNLNGIGDDLVTPLGTDADGDGLDDRFDLINTGANRLKGTSAYMGTSGSITGDATPGSRAMVQRQTPTQPDRDWRFVAAVLPVYMLNLSATENNNNVALSWKVMTSMAITRFEVERSIDNNYYEKIAAQSGVAQLDEMVSLKDDDNISTLKAEYIYYRVKAIVADGRFKYSNVVMVRKGKMLSSINIYPNPASHSASVSLYSEKEEVVTISIKDYAGKLIYLQKRKISKGNNVLPLLNLQTYSSGVYHVQLLANEQLHTMKLIIRN